ncbi:MAG: NAD(+) synthase [Clostridia bacterium]|nr:NAD(+) synthase [Clostridia bacterium]
MTDSTTDNMIDNIINFIKAFFDKYCFNGAIIGISGGVDSAVAGKLVVDAIGKEKVLGVLLPERDSSPDTLQDSILVCDFLGIDYKVINITGLLRKAGVYSLKPPAFIFPKKVQKNYARNIWKSQGEDSYIKDLTTTGDKDFLVDLAYYRMKNRIRMCMLYFEAEKRGYAVVGATNKTEYRVGYYVKWGDAASDIEPILHLYKTEVYQLAEKLHIPKKIIDKKPSPDVAPGITDEFSLGISYQDIDRILMKIENGYPVCDESQQKVKKIYDILTHVKYRRVSGEHI